MSALPAKVDVLIVGAGFSGLYQLHHLRKLGFNVKVFEAGGGIGGTWYWNCYPGARVDCDATNYQLSIDGIWQNWSFSEYFPDWKELREYFAHIDRTLDLGRDISLNTRVVAAEFDGAADEWVVRTEKGDVVRCRFVSFCTGFASKPYTPKIQGMETFRGIIHHTGLWPQEGVDLRDKRVAVIGTGASGVQIVQEAAAVAQQVTIFQRTPCTALPMVQRKLDADARRKLKEGQLEVFNCRRKTFGGHIGSFTDRLPSDFSPEERKEFYEQLYARGGFVPLLCGFRDVYTDDDTNDWAYAFWRDTVRARINDPWLQEKLAPAVKPYPFFAKRPPLEQNYYDVVNQSNVSLIDVNENEITRITHEGIQTADGIEHQFDIIVLATGFDAITGSMIQIDIRGTEGATIFDKWTAFASTYLGLMTTNFPNLFFVYATHGPTAFGNGPTTAEVQSDWVIHCIRYMRDHKLSRIHPKKEAEEEYTKLVNDIGDKGMWSKAKSWYTGANIPGKTVQHLSFSGGLNVYADMYRENEEKGFEGCEFSTRIA
ncbi:FAD dependent oxidoreductase family protein [Pleurotus eryngii]|uniref:FAD dependent oxidoreductase family protein n=1 Tax=Pleurotus eryngii TaxID=5323 RepID=A0A9P6AA16_PLEER|nr:FAD dependent oxidoreductase family protein [Pleurotus eryngii]